MPKNNQIPDRWLDYIPIGKQVEGTRFIAFKVPLSKQICDFVDETNPSMSLNLEKLLDSIPKLGLVIDLTNTTKYNPEYLFKNKIKYKKLRCPGGGNIPSSKIRKAFYQYVKKFLHKNKNNDKLIGVHCTHGVNRTGFLICSYMVTKMNIDPITAIENFENARCHVIERSNYRNAIVKKSTMFKKQQDRRRDSSEKQDECNYNHKRGYSETEYRTDRYEIEHSRRRREEYDINEQWDAYEKNAQEISQSREFRTAVKRSNFNEMPDNRSNSNSVRRFYNYENTTRSYHNPQGSSQRQESRTTAVKWRHYNEMPDNRSNSNSVRRFYNNESSITSHHNPQESSQLQESRTTAVKWRHYNEMPDNRSNSNSVRRFYNNENTTRSYHNPQGSSQRQESRTTAVKWRHYNEMPDNRSNSNSVRRFYNNENTTRSYHNPQESSQPQEWGAINFNNQMPNNQVPNLQYQYRAGNRRYPRFKYQRNFNKYRWQINNPAQQEFPEPTT